jgi:hypothetical protein
MDFFSKFHNGTNKSDGTFVKQFGVQLQNYTLKISKFVNLKGPLIQIPYIKGPFLSVQYDESIHAPD